MSESVRRAQENYRRLLIEIEAARNALVDALVAEHDQVDAVIVSEEDNSLFGRVVVYIDNDRVAIGDYSIDIRESDDSHHSYDYETEEADYSSQRKDRVLALICTARAHLDPATQQFEYESLSEMIFAIAG